MIKLFSNERNAKTRKKLNKRTKQELKHPLGRKTKMKTKGQDNDGDDNATEAINFLTPLDITN